MDGYLSVPEVADVIGVSRQTIHKWIDSGRISGVITLGRDKGIPVSEAEKIRLEELGKAESKLTNLKARIQAMQDSTFGE